MTNATNESLRHLCAFVLASFENLAFLTRSSGRNEITLSIRRGELRPQAAQRLCGEFSLPDVNHGQILRVIEALRPILLDPLLGAAYNPSLFCFQMEMTEGFHVD